MAVYKRTYKIYDGPLTPAWSRFWVLSRYSLSTLFDSRFFTAYTVLCLLPFLAGVAYIYFVHSQTAQLLLNMNFGNQAVDVTLFVSFLGAQAWLGFIMAAWAVPGMMARDFANHALQLYFSRPLSRVEYLLGKIAVMAALLSSITWVPGLVLFFLQAQLEGGGWGGRNLWMAGSILVSCALWIAVTSLLAMALSVWVKWRITATGAMVGVFFLLPGFGQAFNLILRTRWGMLFNLPYVFTVVWAHLFRITPRDIHRSHWDDLPLWSHWAAILAVCVLSLALLNLRLEAKETVRG